MFGCGILINASIAFATDSPAVAAPSDDVDDGVNDCDWMYEYFKTWLL